MTLERHAETAAFNPGLDGIVITDHSMAVYFPENIAWDWGFITNPSLFDDFRDSGNDILAAHLDEIEMFRGRGLIPGIETEMMKDGRLTFDPVFRPRLAVIIGSVHFLPVPDGSGHDEILNIWRGNTLGLLESGIDVLGHPFRWLAGRVNVGRATIDEIVGAARANGVAMELNAHYHIGTDSVMIRRCVELGVPVAIGSDCHTPAEIGDFSYHRRLLASCGLTFDDLNLFRPVG